MVEFELSATSYLLFFLFLFNIDELSMIMDSNKNALLCKCLFILRSYQWRFWILGGEKRFSQNCFPVRCACDPANLWKCFML